MQRASRVSAIIPVHNGSATIARAIESVFAQHAQNFETIVVDDGSTDDTRRILDKYGNRIRVIHLRRGGPALARNAGVAASREEYVAFLDADDEWLPGFLEKATSALEGSPDSVLAFSDILPVDHRGTPVAHFDRAGELRRAPTMSEMLTRWWPILTSAVVMSRRVFQLCGGFPAEFTAAGYEDSWLWLRAREHGGFKYIHEPLVVYRMTPELQRMAKYTRGFNIFSRMVRDRYGADGSRLIADLRRSHASSLGFLGLLNLRLGNRAQARSNFVCALRYRPTSTRNALRVARTFLPYRLARMLSGRTRLLSRADAQNAVGEYLLARD